LQNGPKAAYRSKLLFIWLPLVQASVSPLHCLAFLPVRRYAGAVIPVTLCPCLCLLELGVLAKRLDELSCSVAQKSRSTYRALCCRETGPALARMRLLASGSLSQTLHGLRKFRHDTSIVATCCQLVRQRWTLRRQSSVDLS